MNRETKEALEFALEASKILKERSELYDNSRYDSTAYGRIMKILFPDILATPEEYTRYKYISHVIDKLLRYMINRRSDNILDLANYAFKLLAFDKVRQDKQK